MNYSLAAKGKKRYTTNKVGVSCASITHYDICSNKEESSFIG